MPELIGGTTFLTWPEHSIRHLYGRLVAGEKAVDVEREYNLIQGVLSRYAKRFGYAYSSEEGWHLTHRQVVKTELISPAIVPTGKVLVDQSLLTRYDETVKQLMSSVEHWRDRAIDPESKRGWADLYQQQVRVADQGIVKYNELQELFDLLQSQYDELALAHSKCSEQAVADATATLEATLEEANKYVRVNGELKPWPPAKP
jgi:hypothetical protein